MPGWNNGWGYHGDDGKKYSASGPAEPYGPTYTKGDKIGCGVNFEDESIYYTKNGQFLGKKFTLHPLNDAENLKRTGTADRNLRGQLYPVVGLACPGASVRVRFCEAPLLSSGSTEG